jgi:hypothetical protein
MTKRVAVFRSGVIRGSRHTARPDEKSHLVLFPSFSRYIIPHGRYQPHGPWRHLEVDTTSRGRVHGWLLVGCHVSGVSRPGRVGHSDPQRPSTGSVWRPEAHFTYHLGGGGVVRWIGPLE